MSETPNQTTDPKTNSPSAADQAKAASDAAATKAAAEAAKATAAKAAADKAAADKKADEDEKARKAAVFVSRSKEPRTQHTKDHVATMYITGGGFKGVTLINADRFNEDTMVRVNADGREVDEHGALIGKK